MIYKIDSNNILSKNDTIVFLNGILQSVNDDYVIKENTILFNMPISPHDSVKIIDNRLKIDYCEISEYCEADEYLKQKLKNFDY